MFGEHEEQNLLSTLRKNKWGIGKRVGVIQEFEEKFSAYHEAKKGVACTNCTQALEILLNVSGIKSGDEVIVPAYTFVATASAVAKIGAIPVFADIDPETYTLDPESVHQYITSKTKAIIPVHFAGHFADMEALKTIADEKNLTLIEDAAQAHGAKWNGVFPGKYGRAAGFSFQYSKNMTAGEGGIIISDDEDLIEKCWEHIWHGRKKGGIWYEHFEATSNFRMTEWSAAVLLAQLERLEEQNRRRMDNADYLDQLLRKSDAMLPSKVDGRTEIHPRHLFLLRLNPEVFGNTPKQKIIDALNAEGIPALPGYGFPLYKTPAFQSGNWGLGGITPSRDYRNVHLPNCEQACKDTVWLFHPIFLGNREDMEDIARGIEKVAEHANELK